MGDNIKRLARTEQWISWYEPILNRVGPTLINQRIRPVLTQSKGDINLKQVIAEKENIDSKKFQKDNYMKMLIFWEHLLSLV